MGDSLTDTGSTYSPTIGLIYVFNLIVGTGALTMPRAFETAGWLISMISVCALAFMSYMTATFMIESMATANALRKWKRRTIDPDEQVDCDDNLRIPTPVGIQDALMTEETTETSPLLANKDCSNDASSCAMLFDITERVEMGQMAQMFFNNVGRKVFYISLCVYLYGDLAIYAATVPKSLRDVACTFKNSSANGTANGTGGQPDGDPCWPSTSINRINAYRIFLTCFTLVMGPFLFFNVQKTKYLQLFTTLMRWLSFSMMITLTVIRLAKGEGEGHPQVANVAGLPTLFGVCVYSFMCHHSLPSLATPIRDKSRIHSLFAADYTLILVFYSLLSFTGIFSFSNLRDLYSLDFQPDASDPHPITNVVFIQYFLALFPVFTLSTNFPIIGITLRNNLKGLCLQEHKQYPWAVDRLLFPLATLVPPIIVAFITDNVQMLVGVTGSFAGAGIQYFVPASLVLLSRRDVIRSIGSTAVNKHTSPFRHRFWIVFVFLWAIVCIIFVIVHHLLSWIQGKWE